MDAKRAVPLSRIYTGRKGVEKRRGGIYLTASVHSDQVLSSPDVQTKLEKSMLPQRKLPPPGHLLLNEHVIILVHRSSSILVLRRLEAQGSFRVTLAAFPRAVLRPRRDILPSAACQRRLCSQKTSARFIKYVSLTEASSRIQNRLKSSSRFHIFQVGSMRPAMKSIGSRVP